MAEQRGAIGRTARRRAGIAALVVGGLGAAVGAAALTAGGSADPAPAAAPTPSRPAVPASGPATGPATAPPAAGSPAGTPSASPAAATGATATAAPTTARSAKAVPAPAAPGTGTGRPATAAARAPQPGPTTGRPATGPASPGSAPRAPGASGPGAPAGPDQGAPPAPATGGNPPAPGTPAPAVPAPVTQPPGPAPVVVGTGLDNPRLKDIAQQLVSSAENSSLDWRAQYTYIEDIHDGRGYTGGIIGFTSGTNDMLQLVRHYRALKPDNVLARYIPALEKVDGSASHAGLDPSFVADWHRAAQDAAFQRAQDDERDRVYFDPAVGQAKADGLRALGQFMYYDAIVMHGPGSDRLSFGGIRAAALGKAKPPSQGGDETAYLNAFLDARRAAMKADSSHQDTGRVDTVQRVFLKAGNLDLATPLRWTVYGDSYTIRS